MYPKSRVTYHKDCVTYHKSWVPHISLVFREMWDTTDLRQVQALPTLTPLSW